MSTQGHITIRDTDNSDKDFLKDLHHRAYQDVVTKQFGRWDEAEQDEWFDKDWQPGQYQIVELDGTPVGAFSAEEHDDHLWLKEIQVYPEYQGRGIGSVMLNKVISEAEFRGLNIRLRVLKENDARAFYEQNDFAKTDETETHFIMERYVGHYGVQADVIA